MIGKFVINTAWMALMIGISGLVYIRLAPHDIAALHRPPPVADEPNVPYIKDMRRRITRTFDIPPLTALETLNATAQQTPGTRIIAGSVKEGMITYVTRSLVFGFPDYTTVHVMPDGQGSRVTIYARQRFGRLDFGVNSARVHGWLQALKAVDQAG